MGIPKGAPFMVTIRLIELVRSMACLTLDNECQVWLTRADLVKSGWHEGSSVDRKDFDQYILLHQYPQALNHAVSMLARRPCSKGEIIQHLKRHHYTDYVISLVICKLEKENLLNDQEFCKLWIQHRIHKYGSRRIRQELRSKGISESTTDDALSCVTDEEMLESAIVLAGKAWEKYRTEEDTYKARQKIIASLVRKGFDWDVAKQASDAAHVNKTSIMGPESSGHSEAEG